MKIKYVITAITIGLFTLSNVSAQEKEHGEMNQNHAKMTEQNDANQPAEMTKDTYACSMHPEITSNSAGDCSKCGMKLVKSENSNATAKTYACSMHAEVTSDQPGDCSKCGMVLVEQKMEKKSEDDHKGHAH